MTMALAGNATPSQIRPISASSRNPGTKKPEAAERWTPQRGDPDRDAGSASITEVTVATRSRERSQIT